MLGKLTKNSFKAHASAVYNIYIAMGIIAVLMFALLFIDWSKWGDTGVGMGLAIKCLAGAALCITASVGIIMTFVAVFSDFSRSMYATEGHLTLTLPVRSSTLLLSKWLSGSFWVILSYAAFCLCGFGTFVYIIKHSMSVVEGNELYYSVYDLVMQLIQQICENAGIHTPSFGVLMNLVSMYAISGGIRACVFVLLVYTAITLSHCRPFERLGKLGTVLYFFAGTFIVNTFAAIITKMIKVYIVFNDDIYSFTLSEKAVQLIWKAGGAAFSITNVYCTSVAAVMLFLAAAYLIDRKVNAD